ncbi:glycerate kinase type-2 family protein [Halorussus halobius]|uniref:glycerate kinase type-2 family protein n=1 Tax=Halorussus halobius TaxID=1710537 RepID=UPI0010924CE3|nr:DUF4147 domain-containing protein [Halorussus halobius]
MIRNRDRLLGSDEREPTRSLALDCVEAGIRAADPYRVVSEAVEVRDGVLTVAGESYDLGDYEEVVVLGGGKAAVGTAAALEAALGDRIDRGAVVTDDPESRSDADAPALDRVTVRAGDHPVPSQRGVAATRRVLDLADAADESTLVLAVVTGGASALLPAPAGDLSLADLQATTEALLASGATIGDLNAVRKHCSALKGGRLAERTSPATVVGLAVSDVVGDDLGTVASGPLSPDDSTFADARRVLARYDVDPPAAIRDRLDRGARGEVSETPTAGDPAFERVSVHVVASATTALDAVAEVARERGFDPLLVSSRIRGEAREAAKTHAAIAEEMPDTGQPVDPPAVVLSGGETTVTVRGDGDGGPNLEFALAWALDIDADPDADLALASVDTDGEDGGTGVAGALVGPETVVEAGAAPAGKRRLSAETARDALADSDSLGALADADSAIRTGPTGTNVNDLRVLVVGETSGSE